MDRKKIIEKYPKGQTARLLKVTKRCNISVLIGIIMLVLFYMTNGRLVRAATEQLENVVAMDQFHFASKRLTAAVQSYAAYGNEQYYDTYMNEYLEDKTREKSISILFSNNLTEDEMNELNQIYDISNDLIPIELSVLSLKKEGNSEKAVDIIYGADYQNSVNEIEKRTEDIIQKISNRLGRRIELLRFLQIMFGTLFFGSFLYIMYQVFFAVRFARRELLVPILKVSEVMHKLCKGSLHLEQDLPKDDSEVGRMVNDIGNMQAWMSAMILEISQVLEKMGGGDFGVTMNQKYLGDFETIKDSFLSISDQMGESLKMIHAVSEEVNGGSLQLAQAADGLATACTAQAAQISDIILLINELNEIIQDNKKQAEEAVKISNCSVEALLVNERNIALLHKTLEENKDNMKEETYELLRSAINASSDNMEEVMIGTNETTERIMNVVSRLENEVNNIHQIEENVAEIAGIIDNNSATSEETAAISEEQKAQVEILIELLERYKV